MGQIIVATSLPQSSSRRGFLQTCLVLGAAPAIVKLSSLMPVRQVVSATELDAERVIAKRLNLVGGIWETDAIYRFYANARSYSEEDRQIIEQDIFLAQSDGRIKQSGHDNYFKHQWGYKPSEV